MRATPPSSGSCLNGWCQLLARFTGSLIEPALRFDEERTRHMAAESAASHRRHERTLNRTHTNSYIVADGWTHATGGQNASQPAAQIAEHGVGR